MESKRAENIINEWKTTTNNLYKQLELYKRMKTFKNPRLIAKMLRETNSIIPKNIDSLRSCKYAINQNIDTVEFIIAMREGKDLGKWIIE